MAANKTRDIRSGQPGGDSVKVGRHPKGLIIQDDDGTAEPSEHLDIQSSAGSVRAQVKSLNAAGSGNQILDGRTAVVGSVVAQLQLRWNGNIIGLIRGVTGDDTTNEDEGDIAFLTAASGSLAEHMRLTQEGNLGVGGETSPATELHVAGALTFTERTAEPSDPAEGDGVMWLSNGTGFGDDGDICAKSNPAGTVRKNIVHDHSAGST